MLKNYFKIALRSLGKGKTYTTINILGLAAGMASFIIVLLALNYELSYDTWDPKLEQVYKVSMRFQDEIQEATPAPLASLLAEKHPNIEAATSMQGTGDYEVLISSGQKSIYQKGFASSDSLFLEVFPYQLIHGDRATALNVPNSVIISEELAKTLFGDSNPMGETIKVFNAVEGVVTGVIKVPETPSHRNVHLVMRDPYEQQNFFWNNHSYDTYIKLKEPVAEADLEEDLNTIYFEERIKSDKQQGQASGSSNHTVLFTDVVPNIQNFSKYGNSNIKTISILFILAILLLFTGAINFSNLTIAKSISRAKEVGIRKTLGSGRRNLIFQFMSETALQCSISLIIALIIVIISLPFINTSLNLDLNFWGQNSAELLLQLGICLAVITFLSGIYPSLYLSRLNPVKVLKGDISGGKKGLGLRNVLLTFQFIVTAFFIVAIFGVNKQLDYLQNSDKGFVDEQVLRIEATQATREQGFAQTRRSLLSIPGVRSVAKTTTVPGDKIADSSTVNFNYKGDQIRMGSVKVSTDYFETLQVPLVEGRFFNESYADQNTRNAIINETAARKLNVTNPIGETISFGGCDEGDVQIVGVVKDINVHGFEFAIKPAVYTIENKACMYQSGGAILVKLKSDQVQATITAIGEQWKSIEPNFPIRYSFIDANFQQLFSTYYRLQKILTFFGSIAILISIMGLFALTAFIIKQRNKEIGIRKVLGANVKTITALIGKDFLVLVCIASLISIPISAWALNKWLNDFAYQTSIEWWAYAGVTIVVILLALITVSIQTVHAAASKPVKSLRTE
ncbi:ABC transporter permease [Salegentibacter sp. LM13S]|uniref:ABC transporter permease n=1 Tax=Salegentibacter lacus TaxID=2873599 RepID=UPI001CCECEFB|nr:ABC transporter permease [Salegentibacter lacus]MBZ9629722.1 ABC transporter permease [Salegentibacter lacus]